MILSLLITKCNKSEFNDKSKPGPEDSAKATSDAITNMIVAAAAAASYSASQQGLPTTAAAMAAADAVSDRFFSPELKFRKASYQGQIEKVKRFLTEGIDPNTNFQDGQTALMAASDQGQIEVVSTLLAAGANVNAFNILDQTALMIAKKNKHKETVAILELYRETEEEFPKDEEGKIEKIEKIANDLYALKSSIKYLSPFASRLIEIFKNVEYEEASTEEVLKLLKLSNSEGEIDDIELEIIHKHLLLYLCILDSKNDKADIASSILNYISTPKILSGEISYDRYPVLMLAFAKDEDSIIGDFGKGTKFGSAFSLEELSTTYGTDINKGVEDLIKICQYRKFQNILGMLERIQASWAQVGSTGTKAAAASADQ